MSDSILTDEALDAMVKYLSCFSSTPMNSAAEMLLILKRDRKRLRDALRKHLHTQKCFDYAVQTAARGRGSYCIAECSDSHREALGE